MVFNAATKHWASARESIQDQAGHTPISRAKFQTNGKTTTSSKKVREKVETP